MNVVFQTRATKRLTTTASNKSCALSTLDGPFFYTWEEKEFVFFFFFLVFFFFFVFSGDNSRHTNELGLRVSGGGNHSTKNKSKERKENKTYKENEKRTAPSMLVTLKWQTGARFLIDHFQLRGIGDQRLATCTSSFLLAFT